MWHAFRRAGRARAETSADSRCWLPYCAAISAGKATGTASYHRKTMPRYAAIDIGSNSIRMEAAEVVPGQPARVLASEREVTRLGESVFRTGAVSEDAMRASCAVLARMARSEEHV